ncbi:hypothetical protein J8273_1744 [Carpediemonas membranifera]|uniref:Uncharacterized protein n=1 Tax=Carpediemonas membranifera TaxID=201153 RepID=A0A8J6C0M2_9EUKA|nr:hypothetical protein J8273_1744 [Carpediemonas membranifera]|eukprot:KAG9396726.1 hypothetical protein J8273_1744 [Carpediemonas membranifera]
MSRLGSIIANASLCTQYKASAEDNERYFGVADRKDARMLRIFLDDPPAQKLAIVRGPCGHGKRKIVRWAAEELGRRLVTWTSASPDLADDYTSPSQRRVGGRLNPEQADCLRFLRAVTRGSPSTVGLLAEIPFDCGEHGFMDFGEFTRQFKEFLATASEWSTPLVVVVDEDSRILPSVLPSKSAATHIMATCRINKSVEVLGYVARSMGMAMDKVLLRAIVDQTSSLGQAIQSLHVRGGPAEEPSRQSLPKLVSSLLYAKRDDGTALGSQPRHQPPLALRADPDRILVAPMVDVRCNQMMKSDPVARAVNAGVTAKSLLNLTYDNYTPFYMDSEPVMYITETMSFLAALSATFTSDTGIQDQTEIISCGILASAVSVSRAGQPQAGQVNMAADRKHRNAPKVDRATLLGTVGPEAMGGSAAAEVAWFQESFGLAEAGWDGQADGTVVDAAVYSQNGGDPINVGEGMWCYNSNRPSQQEPNRRSAWSALAARIERKRPNG